MSERVIHGPTWRRGEDGAFVLPSLSLGWHAIAWAEEYLLQPDGPDAGEPWRFTREQARHLVHWYAVDCSGRFLYRTGVYRRMKGAGKNPYAAVICAIELVGPCRFSGEWRDGQPIGQPHHSSWVQTAAVSREQTRNAMTLMPSLFSGRAIDEYGIDLGKEIIYANRGRARLESVTSSPRALEGGRATFVVMDEVHHWLPNNEGVAMAEVIARNAAKSRDGASRALAITNAHAPGEGSVGEQMWEAYNVSPAGVLYDSLEAAPVEDLTDTAALREALEVARGDSTWLDIERLVAEIQDPRTPANLARRFYLNQLAAGTDRAFDRERFAALVRPGYQVAPGALITLGFDGSESHDHTVLIGTEVATGYQWVVGYWVPFDGRIEVAAVSQTVAEAFERWNVWRLYADPFYWQEQIASWAGRWNRPGQERVVEWNTTLLKRMAYALLGYRTAIDGGEVSHDGDPRFVAAIGNAYRHEQMFVDDNGERMWTITKERKDSPLKIDAAMAGCLSWQARRDAVALGVLEQSNRIVVYIPGAGT